MNVLTQLPSAYDYDRDRRLRAVFEEAAIGIGICQLDGQILEANPALSRLLGYSPQELAGVHAGALALEAGRPPSSPERASPDPASPNHASPNHASPNQRWIEELIRGKRGFFEIEKRYRRSDGSELWGHLTVSLGRDTRQQPAFLIALLEDATERRRIQEHLREAEKMEVIGRLAGGIAHDFNNLLTGILLYCDLLSAGLEQDCPAVSQLNSCELNSCEPGEIAFERARPMTSELSQHVKEVRMAGEHGAALTQQLLAIARKQSAEPRPVRINEIVASTKNLLQRLIGEQIELVMILDPVLDPVGDPVRENDLDGVADDIPTADRVADRVADRLTKTGLARQSAAGFVLADPAQLRQILLNLVLNARDAMPEGGTIRLSTRATEFPGDPSVARRAVALAVTDHGCGMDATTRARLFEPFFTTKNPGEGTGLGLATVQRIVSATGGIIEVQSEPGRGTSIEVFLPSLESHIHVPSIAESSDEDGSSGKG
jgi:two-component system cell cycle sensor histidine kinase/response regulator CckA